MKIVGKNLKQGEIRLEVSTLDDLWYLSQIIDAGDEVTGKTSRKIKIGDSENAKNVKKVFTLSVVVDKVEYSKSIAALRVMGKVSSENEDVPKGSSHTISISADEHDTLKIKKPQWLSYQLQKIEEASSPPTAKIMILVLDREEAFFALLRKSEFEILVHLEGEVSKKANDEKQKQGFYPKLIEQMKMYVGRFNLDKIIIASPAFFKEDLLKVLKDDSLRKKITLATCSSVDRNGINEVLKRDEVKTVLAEDRIAKETKLVDELFASIAKNGAVVYGENESMKAAAMGAVEKILVTDNLIMKKRENQSFGDLDRVLKDVDRQKGVVHIISAEHDAGKRLDGLGGIGCMLRYRVNL